MEWTPLPVGVENFEEIITKGYYYVDKTKRLEYNVKTKNIIKKGM